MDEGWDYQPGDTVADTVRALAGKLDKLPPKPSIDLIQSWLKAEAFAHWYDNPTGAWPLVRLPDADAQALGAADGVRVALLSDTTAAKQAAHHPELTADDYAEAQKVIDQPTAKTIKTNPSGTRSMIYVQEENGYVLVIKATLDGQELYVTSYYRLHSDDARRSREIARLLAQGEKK